MYARPQIGTRLIGKVQAISSHLGADSQTKVTLVCTIEAGLTCVINNFDLDRFAVKSETTAKPAAPKKKDADSLSSDDDDFDSDDNDSIMGDNEVFFLEDTKKENRKIVQGSKVKLQLTDVKVSEGSLISYATLI